MTDRESEVPLDRQDAMQNATDGQRPLARQPSTTDWHDCPKCGTRLSGLSLFHTNDDVLAVTYSCLHDDCFARWVWETATDEPLPWWDGLRRVYPDGNGG
jgi:hypothetical protein